MIVLIFLSVALLLIAFPSFYFTFGYNFFSWIFAVPLFLALHKKHLTKRLMYGFLFGAFFYSILVSWFIPYNFPGYVFFVLALMIQPMVFFALYQEKGRGVFFDSFYVSSAWVLSEYVRTIIMKGFTWGIGHSQGFNVYAIQIANLFGPYSISFVLIFCNYCL